MDLMHFDMVGDAAYRGGRFTRMYEDFYKKHVAEIGGPDMPVNQSDRDELDVALSKQAKKDVERKGNVEVHVDAPAGTTVKTDGPVFKDATVSRTMTDPGAAAGKTPETPSGVGHN
jgi:hypothetical protein